MATTARPDVIPDGYEWDDAAGKLFTGRISEMNENGDTKVEWNRDNPAEVDVARKAFDRLVGEKGFAAFKVGRDGGKGERIRDFDARAERILLVPPMQGG